MAKILILVAVIALGYLGYEQYFGSAASVDKSEYSFATVETRPIPKGELITLWKDVAFNNCENARKDHNLTPDECRMKINERHTNCHSSASLDVPDTINTKQLAKQVGRKYLECVTPYYFCNGKEAKTEEEVQRYCS